MVNGTQIVFKNFPVGPLEGVPEKYISTRLARMLKDNLRAYTEMKAAGS